MRRYHDSLRSGLTLIEMLAALVISLMMMFAVAQLFGTVTTSVSASRAMIEMNDRLRMAVLKLRQDLGNATCDMTPWQRTEMAAGYFEYIEGPSRDGAARRPYCPNLSSPSWSQVDASLTSGLIGDGDDAIFLTTRNTGIPFLATPGYNPANTDPNYDVLATTIGEIAWFTRPALDPQGNPLPWRNLFRHIMLVAPDQPSNIPPSRSGITTFNTDISGPAASNGAGGYVPSFCASLVDLQRRESRYAHSGPVPAPILDPELIPSFTELENNSTLDRRNEDLVLTHVVGFDVKIWDPGAPVYVSGGSTVVPGDPNYLTLVKTATPSSFGAYADLNYLTDYSTTPAIAVSYTPPPGFPKPQFSGPGDLNSPLYCNPSAARQIATYDTWSTYYNRRTSAPISNGSSGLDLNNSGGVGDPGERVPTYGALPPPYPYPMRAIQIKIRIYEPDSRTVREVTVHESFVVN